MRLEAEYRLPAFTTQISDRKLLYAFDKLCRRPRVQSEFVGDAHLTLRRSGRFLVSESHAWLVPQRRCRNLSIGEKKILSASRPITTITIMIPMTCSMAFNSRP